MTLGDIVEFLKLEFIFDVLRGWFMFLLILAGVIAAMFAFFFVFAGALGVFMWLMDTLFNS